MKDYLENLKNNYSFEVLSTNTIDQLFTYHFFVDSVKLYISTYLTQWDYIDSHYGNLKNFIYKEIIKLLEHK